MSDKEEPVWFTSLADVEGLDWEPPIEVEVDQDLAQMVPKRQTGRYARRGELQWASDDRVLDEGMSPVSEALSAIHDYLLPADGLSIVVHALMLPGTITDYLHAALAGADRPRDPSHRLLLIETAIAIVESNRSRVTDALSGSEWDAELLVAPYFALAWFLRGQGHLKEAVAAEEKGVDLLGREPVGGSAGAAATRRSLEEIAAARSS